MNDSPNIIVSVKETIFSLTDEFQPSVLPVYYTALYKQGKKRANYLPAIENIISLQIPQVSDQNVFSQAILSKLYKVHHVTTYF
jgi:hypothetical protein